MDKKTVTTIVLNGQEFMVVKWTRPDGHGVKLIWLVFEHKGPDVFRGKLMHREEF